MAANVDGGSISIPQAGGVKITPTNWGGIERQSMKTLDAMNKLTEGMVSPYIEKMEKQQFYEGQAKVFQGQTLAQVEKEDPWYMNIIGPSATVRGAQMMTASTAVQQAETEYMTKMPELRKQSPEQVRQYLVDKATNIQSTGDPLVDATIQAKMAESWGPMMKTHTREHMAFTQEDMYSRFTNNNVSVGAGMQSTLEAHQTTEWPQEERAQSATNAVLSMQPLPGQDDESWQKATSETMRANLQAGHFEWYKAIQQSDVYNKINPKTREQMESNYHMLYEKSLAQNPAARDITMHRASFEQGVQAGTAGISSLEELNKVMDGLDAEHSKLTGSDKPYYDNKAREVQAEKWLNGKDRMDKLAQAAIQKDVDEEEKARTTMTAVSSAVTNSNPNMGKWPWEPKYAAQAMDDRYKTALESKDPNAMPILMNQLAAVASNPLLRSPALESQMRMGATALLSGNGPLSKGQQTAFGLARQLYTSSPDYGVEALTQYLGADNAAKVITMINSGVDPSDEKGLDQQRALMKTGKPNPTQSERTAVGSYIKDQAGGWLTRFMGKSSISKYDLNPQALAQLTDAVTDQTARYTKQGLPQDQAMGIAMSDTMRNSDMVSGAIVFNTLNTKEDHSLIKGLNTYIASQPGGGGKKMGPIDQNTSTYQEAVTHSWQGKLTASVTKAGGKMENFDAKEFYVASGTQIGHGVVQLTIANKDSSKLGLYTVRVAPKDVYDSMQANDIARNKKTKYGPTDFTFPPPL